MSVKILVSLILVLKLSIVLSSPVLKSNYIEQEHSCREVCGLCDCDGFYCEDECICECSIKDEDNLQCIADMKTECDKNGLEYELLMQDSTKERFLRQIKPNIMPFEKLSKNLVIIKKKREEVPASKETVVAAPEPVHDDPIVAAPVPAPSQHSRLLPQLNLDRFNFDNLNLDNLNLPTLPTIAPERRLQMPNLEGFEPSRLVVSLRDRITTTTLPPTLPPRSFSIPRLTFSSPSPISLPTINFPGLDGPIVQPRGTW